MAIELLEAALRAACDPDRQRYLATYFGLTRTAFLGLTAVAAKRVARAHADAFTLREVLALLRGPSRELRYVALAMLVRKYEQGDREAIARAYLRALRHVDHWVLVDVSAPYILGRHLVGKPRRILRQLAASRRMTDRRVAIVATWALTRAGDVAAAHEIAALLAADREPLVRSAVRWMVAEAEKQSLLRRRSISARRANRTAHPEYRLHRPWASSEIRGSPRANRRDH